MKGIVLYSENRQKALEMKELFETRLGFLFEVWNMDLFDDFSGEPDYIAAEWNLRVRLIKFLQKKDIESGVAFYNESFVSDIDNTAKIDMVLNQAVSSHNWELCKSLNLFYLTGDIIRKRNVLRSRPTKMQIETTDLCNAKCIMCSHAYSDGTGIDILQSGIIDKLEKILPFVKVIVLHGNGEPFLKKNITEYLRQMSQYGIKFIANTNLSIITDDLLEFFNTSFLELNISCDGHTKELYESIRRGLSYERFVKNIETVRKKCPNLIMKMSVVVMRQNMMFLPEIVEFARKMGFNEIILNQLCVDEKNGNLQDAAYLYLDDLVKYTSLALEKGIQKNIKVIVPYTLNPAEDAKTGESGDSTDVPCLGVCDWVVECPYIDLRGNVAPCCIKQKESLGNLYEHDFESVWNGEPYVKIRSEFRKENLPVICKGCDFANQGRLEYLSVQNIGFKSLEKEKRC